MLLIFARAGEFYPALNLFASRLEGETVIAKGYIANLELTKGRKLVQIEPDGKRWKPMADGLALEVPFDTQPTANTFKEEWRTRLWIPPTPNK
jgi:hypothetical protein